MYSIEGFPSSYWNIFLFSSDDGRDPVYTEDGEYESVTSSEDEKGTSFRLFHT